MNINDYLRDNPGRVRKAIRTKRGRLLSVQASDGHYCSPRANTGPYCSVEVMVCEGPHPRAFIRSNGGQRNADGVYAFVPVSVVEDVINRVDGGVK